MRDLALFGDKAGTFLAEIAAPGADLANATGRRLFTTLAEMTQVIFSDEVTFSYSVSSMATSSPFGSVTDYFLRGTATYYFPSVLNFAPEAFIVFFRRKDDTPEYIYPNVYGTIGTTYKSYTDRIEITYYEAVSSGSSAQGLSARVNILSVPWDYPL